jgi:hypothetical protein
MTLLFGDFNHHRGDVQGWEKYRKRLLGEIFTSSLLNRRRHGKKRRIPESA